MNQSLHPYLRVAVHHPAPHHGHEDTIEIKGAGTPNQNHLALTFAEARWLAKTLYHLTTDTPVPDAPISLEAAEDTDTTAGTLEPENLNK